MKIRNPRSETLQGSILQSAKRRALGFWSGFASVLDLGGTDELPSAGFPIPGFETDAEMLHQDWMTAFEEVFSKLHEDRLDETAARDSTTGGTVYEFFVLPRVSGVPQGSPSWEHWFDPSQRIEPAAVRRRNPPSKASP